jgi:predicted nucleic acid-binding protein
VTRYLLDTNVISEVTRPQPSATVLAWLAAVDQNSVFLSAVTIAELRYGMERLPAGQRRKRLSEWLFADVPARFGGRILSVDDTVAHAWGQAVAMADAAGKPIAIMDAFVLATAVVHQLTLVTRNERDFRMLAPAIVNPWTI